MRAAARRAASLGAALEGAQSNVAATHAAGWSGVAATAFAGTVQADALAVGAASTAFTEAAGALDELASALRRARERVLEAARRLREAREEAARAEERARDARAAADSAQANAMLDPTSPLNGPLMSEASVAEDAALRAESAAAMARDELARVERWANREADDAVADARAADQRTAAAVEGAAGYAGPMGVSTTTPGGGSPLTPLGSYLRSDLFNYWGGGDTRRSRGAPASRAPPSCTGPTSGCRSTRRGSRTSARWARRHHSPSGPGR